MKKLQSLLLVFMLAWSGIFTVSAQSPESGTPNQSEIFQKQKGIDNWRLIGKCDSSLIFEKRNDKKIWTVVGKFEENLIYQKRSGKDKWEIVGKYEEGLIYQRLSTKGKWKIVGKYNEGLIYETRLGKDKLKIVGKYVGCPGAAGFLLLLSNDDDISWILLLTQSLQTILGN